MHVVSYCKSDVTPPRIRRQNTGADTWSAVYVWLPGKQQLWLLQNISEESQRRPEGDSAARENWRDGFTAPLGVTNTPSSAFQINCVLTPSSNFALMWQHGTNRKHPWKKQPTHTSFKWPQLSSRDYKVCACACVCVDSEQMWVAAVLARDRDLLYLDCNSIRAQGVTP